MGEWLRQGEERRQILSSLLCYSVSELYGSPGRGSGVKDKFLHSSGIISCLFLNFQ